MSRQNINIGTNLNDGTGDKLRDAMKKVNDNFIELYEATLSSGGVHIENAIINTTNISSPDLTLAPTAQGNVNVAYGLNVNTGRSVNLFQVWSSDINDDQPLFYVNTADKHVDANGGLNADSLNVTNSAVVYGNVQIGTSPSNYLTLLSQVQGDIIPVANDTNSIGTPSLKYVAGYFGSVATETITSTDFTTTNANVTILRTSADAFLGDFLIRDSMISNRVPDTNLELRTDGTGRVYVSSGIIVGALAATGEKLRVNGDITLNGNLVLQSRTIASSIGTSGDIAGMTAIDNDYIYRCTANYDGSTNIWTRVALSATPW